MLTDIKNHLFELQDVQGEADEILAAVANKARTSSEKTDQFIKEYNDEIKPAIVSATEEVKEKLTSVKILVNDIQKTIPKAEKLLHSTDNHLDEGQETLKKVLGEFPYVQDKVKETAERIRGLKDETNLSHIIDLLKNNPEAERG